MKKLQQLQISFLLFLSMVTLTLSAQVTIGDGTPPQKYSVLELSTTSTKGGLRLPQLNSQERNDLTTAAFRADQLAAGLAIYNTDTGCYEYWNNRRWISLCEGNSQMNLNPAPCAEINADGIGCDSEFTVIDPDCPTGPFSFVVIVGSEFASLSEQNEVDGTFRIIFQPNNSINIRSVVVRITASCTNLYKDFIFTQKGEECDTGLGMAPDISSALPGKAIQLCLGGAVYLSVPADTPNIGSLIWTRNGVEIARGVNNIAVTQQGIYDVWMGIIGCNQKEGNAITVTKREEAAPSPVDFIVVGNNGVVCGEGGTIELVVTSVTDGEIVWYRDGQKTSLTGSRIQAGKGEWFAVIEEGSCTSQPTKVVTITENTDTGAGLVTMPVIKINGVTSGYSLCKGGSMYLEVATPEAGVKYTWYIDNDEIGIGKALYYPVPSGDSFVLRLRATGAGCAQEALLVESISVTTAPGAPFISVNSDDVLCGGKATLTASNPGGTTSYRWFKNTVEMLGKTTASIEVTETGVYTVCAIVGNCTSIQSGPKTIKVSDFATLSWVSHPTTVNVGDTKTYSVSLDFPQSASYIWTVSGGEVTNGEGTNSITVNFSDKGTASVQCDARNACGTALSSPLSESFTVGDACTPAQILGTSNLNPAIKVNNSALLSVTALGTNPTYQWYSGTLGAGVAILDATSSTYSYTPTDTGDLLFYCVVTAEAPCDTPIATSPQFKVTTTQDPASITTGTGVFGGKTCFDIAYSNDNSNSCAPLSSRSGQKTFFANRAVEDPYLGSSAPYTGVQIYTFKPTGTVSNVRFDYVDVTGNVIKSMTPVGDYSGNGISDECKVTVEFNENLDEDLKGLTRQTALTAELYVIYNDNSVGTGTDKSLRLNLTLQDCACCGAKTVSGGWLTFMCHNLGANEALDPFTYSTKGNTTDADIKGSLYQWGRPGDGHQRRSSKTTTTLSSSNTPGHTLFITSTNNPHDWRSGGGNISRWGDGSQDENVAKAENDPCPIGWKVPSQKQWQSIYKASGNGTTSNATANIWSWTGYGYMVGDALYLPVAGYRRFNAGELNGTDINGLYWSSTVTGSQSHYLTFAFNGVNPGASSYRVNGFSVRCVSEY